MAPFPENSSIFSCVLYTYVHVVPLAAIMKQLYTVHSTGYFWYTSMYIYIPCYTSVWFYSLLRSPNLTVSLRTHCAQSAASSSGNAEQFPQSDICYLLIFVHTVFLYMRRGVVQQLVCSQCCILLMCERCIETHRCREIPFCAFWLVFLFNSLPDPAQQEDPACIQKCQSKSKTQWRKLNQGETEKNTANPENIEKVHEGAIGKLLWERRQPDRGGNCTKRNTENRRLGSKRQSWS